MARASCLDAPSLGGWDQAWKIARVETRKHVFFFAMESCVFLIYMDVYGIYMDLCRMIYMDLCGGIHEDTHLLDGWETLFVAPWPAPH